MTPPMHILLVLLLLSTNLRAQVTTLNDIPIIRATPVIDIRAYGAICDGAHPSTDALAIQKAINAAGAIGIGAIVTGPKAATCNIPASTTLNMLANVNLRGFTIKAASAMIVAMIGTNNLSNTCSGSINNVRVEDMVLDGQRTALTYLASGIALYCTSNSHIDNNLIQNIGWEGIVTYNNNINIEFGNNKFAKIYGDCIHSDGPNTDGVVMQGNTCDAQWIDADGGFSSGTQTSNVVIKENVVKNLGKGFCYESPGSNQVVIDGNICESGYDNLSNGIRVYNFVGVDAYDITISNNDIGAPPASGYAINVLEPNASHQSNGIKILGNRISGTASSTGGIYLLGHTIQVENNYVYLPNVSANCYFIDGGVSRRSNNVTLNNNVAKGCGTGIGGGSTPYTTNISLGTSNTFIGTSTRSTVTSGNLVGTRILGTTQR